MSSRVNVAPSQAVPRTPSPTHPAQPISSAPNPAYALPGAAGGGLGQVPSLQTAAMVSVTSPLHAGKAVGSAASDAPAHCSSTLSSISVAERTPLAWSGSGNRLAAVSGSNSLFVLSLGTDVFHVEKHLSGHRHAVRALLFHPTDENVLVSAGADGVWVWDIAAGAVTQMISTKTAADFDLPASNRVVHVPGAHDADVECMTWTHGGACLVTGSRDMLLKVWDTTRRPWRLLETVAGHKAPVLCAQYCPATQRLATAGRDACIKVWDAATLGLEWRAKRADDSGVTVGLLGTCEGHGDVLALTWTSDGSHIIAGQRDNSIKLWDAATCSEVRDVFDKKLGIQGKHRSDVCAVSMLGAGNEFMLSCSLDGTVRVWHMAPLEEEVALAAGAAATGGAASTPSAGAASAAGALLGGTDSASVGASVVGVEEVDVASAGWDDTTRALLQEILGGGAGGATTVTKAAGVDHCLDTLHFFSSEEGVCSLHMNPVRPIAAISSSGNAFALLTLRMDTLPWLQRQYDGTLPPGALPPGTVLSTLVQVQAFSCHTRTVNAVQLINDDRSVVSASSDYTVAQYDVSTVERHASFALGASATSLVVAPVAGNPTPVIFVGCADYSIRAFSSNPADYAPLRAAYASRAHATPLPAYELEMARYTGHAGRVESLSVDAAGKYMASGGRDWNVLIWDLTRPAPTVSRQPVGDPDRSVNEPVARLDAHMGHVTCVRFSSSEVGNLLATAGNDHLVKVWRMTTGLTGGITMSKLWESGTGSSGGHLSNVSALAWGKGDLESQSLLLSGSWDTSVKLWNAVRPNTAAAVGASTAGSGSLGAPTASDVESRNASSIAPLSTFTGHTSRVTGLDCSPAGGVAVSVSADFTARVWRYCGPPMCLAIIFSSPTSGILTSVSVGRAVFATGCDAGVQVWPLQPRGEYAHYFQAGGAALPGALPAALPALMPLPTLAAGTGTPLVPRNDSATSPMDKDAQQYAVPLLSSS